jgi:hypothetical protein
MTVRDQWKISGSEVGERLRRMISYLGSLGRTSEVREGLGSRKPYDDFEDGEGLGDIVL